MSLSDKTVLAKPKQIVEEFAEWVNQGLYKKISASFYGKANPDNPTPGKIYLKHVGYLGAVPPIIKGMPDSAFSESDGEVLTLEFSELDFGDWSDNINADLWRSLREWLIETADIETADRVIPTHKLDSLLEMALRPAPVESVSNYSENPMPLTEAELEQREQAIALRERAATLKEQELQFSEALDAVIKDGRVLAVEKPSHLKRLKMLAAIPADNVADFAEGKADYSPTAEYLAELKARPVVVNFSEVSGGEPPEVTTDPQASARAIQKRVNEAKAEGRTLSFAEADAEIRAEQNGAKN